MKVGIFIVALLLLLFSTGSKDEIRLELGSVLPARYVPKKNVRHYMTSSAQLDPYIEATVDGIEYIIAYQRKGRKITYISTDDVKFKTSDGLQIGSHINVTRAQIAVIRGWEIRGPVTKDGWYPLIGFDNELTAISEGVERKLDVEKVQPDQPVTVSITSFVKARR